MPSRDRSNALPTISRPSPGQAAAGVGGLPVKGQLFPPARPQPLPAVQAGVQAQPTKKGVIKGGKLVISHPIIQEDELSEQSPLKRIATIDLATAAKQDQERRVNVPQQAINTANIAAPRQSIADTYNQQGSKHLERKQVGASTPVTQMAKTVLSPTEKPPPVSAQGTSSAVLAVPGVENSTVRQRSPKHISQCFQEANPPKILARTASGSEVKDHARQNSIPDVPLQPPPRSPLRLLVGKGSPSTPLKTQTNKPFVETLGQTESSNDKESGDAALLTSPQQVSEVPVAGKETASRTKSIASPSKTVRVLVPPVPPLSPRVPPSQSYSDLKSSSGSQRRNNSVSSSIPRSGSVKNNIRPSRQRPTTPPPDIEEGPRKTQVLIRGTTGLPNNPRPRTAKDDANNDQPQTVMSINEIPHSDPSRIEAINNSVATGLGPGTGRDGPEGSASVVNRPRPIPRKVTSVDSKEPPGTPQGLDVPSPNNAAGTKPFILNSTAGSPSQLPPLPLPPLTPKGGRVQIGPTKPFTSPSKVNSLKSNEIAIPTVRLNAVSRPTATQGPGRSQEERLDAERKVRDPTTQPASTSMVDAVSLGYGKRAADAAKYVSKFSIATTMSPEDPPSEYLQSPALALLRSSQEGLKRRSSPVLPMNDLQESATPISINMGQPAAISAAPIPERLASESLNIPVTTRASYSSSMQLNDDDDDDKEMVTFMLDRNTYYPKNAASTPPHNRIYGGTEGKSGSWHRRVGENPPTFSDRESMQSRRVPKPPPLQLSRVTRRSKEPAPAMSPLETPRRALDQIQEQLNKFEAPDADDIGLENRRMSLLADIEMEMGMEENRWQNMHNDLARASFSSVGSNAVSPFATELSPLPPQIAQSPAIGAINEVPQGSGSNLVVREGHSARPRSSILYTADQVQISRLNAVPARFHAISAEDAAMATQAGATGEEVSAVYRNTPSNATSSPLDNNTVRSPSAVRVELKSTQKEEGASERYDLWQPVNEDGRSRATASQASLWNSASESAIQSAFSLSPGPRPVTRKSAEAAPVDDSGLWDKPSESSGSQSTSSSLWEAKVESPSSTAPRESSGRPQTLRPPRKSRRMTSLPDIVENPEPLENKRGTLGIFQFPWGERSDTATLPPALQNQMFMGLPVNTVTGAPPIFPTLEMQMQILQSQQQSSSFFDHQDEDEAIVDMSEDSDNDDFYGDDDSFDETTLWEIASLLQSDKVPSRESLFPDLNDAHPGSLVAQGPTIPNVSSSRTRVPEPANEEDLESVNDEQSSPPILRRESSSPTLPPPEATLWVNNVFIPSSNGNHGLFQDDKLWGACIADQEPMARAPPRQTEASTITSTSLWSPPTSKVNTPPSKTLWCAKMESHQAAELVVCVREITRPVTPEAEFMWSAPKSTSVKSVGLAEPAPDSWLKYLSLGERSSYSRKRKDEVSIVESQFLWSPDTPQEVTIQWLEPEETALPSVPDHGHTNGPSSILDVISSALPQFVTHATTSTIEAPIQSTIQEPEEVAIPVNGEAIYSVDNAVGPEEDIVTPDPRGNDLWVPVSVLGLDEGNQGLFQAGQGVLQRDKKYRRASNPPAALATRPTPRSARRSLPTLESQTLWVPPTQITYSQDWISLSSIRPRTPPGRLSPESGSESPFSEISSTYSNATGESTVDSFHVNQAVTQLKPQFVTDADWMATLKGTGRATRPRDEIEKSVPNWAAALHNIPDEEAPALSASPQLTEPETSHDQLDRAGSDTEAESDEELSSQVPPIPEEVFNPFSSRRQTQMGGFDPARHHPVFNVYTLDTSDGECHPAAQGYIYTLVNHNPDLIQR